MNTAKPLISTGLNLRNYILSAALGSLCVMMVGCSKPSSSVDISGTWIEPMEIGENSFTCWDFSPDGKFTKTITLAGNAEAPETGSYKIRPPRTSENPVPGDIVECSSPDWKHPELFRIPPNSSTLVIKVNCDDDSFSGGNPECWVTKKGSSPATLQASDSLHVFTGTVVSTEQKSSGVMLRLDTKVHGKRLECVITDDDLIKNIGDVMKLEGKRIQVRGKPEEYWRNVLIFLEDSEQLKLLE